MGQINAEKIYSITKHKTIEVQLEFSEYSHSVYLNAILFLMKSLKIIAINKHKIYWVYIYLFHDIIYTI